MTFSRVSPHEYVDLWNCYCAVSNSQPGTSRFKHCIGKESLHGKCLWSVCPGFRSPFFIYLFPWTVSYHSPLLTLIVNKMNHTQVNCFIFLFLIFRQQCFTKEEGRPPTLKLKGNIYISTKK